MSDDVAKLSRKLSAEYANAEVLRMELRKAKEEIAALRALPTTPEAKELLALRNELRAINKMLVKARFSSGAAGVARALAHLEWNIQAVTDLKANIQGLRKMIKRQGTELCECKHADWLANTLGHDAVGHRTANILKRAGYFTEQDLKLQQDFDLMDLRGMGIGCLERIHQVIDHCDTWGETKRRVDR